MSLTYRTPWQAAAHDIAAGRAADPAWPARLLDGWREEARRLRDEVRASGGTIALHADADRAGPDQATDAIARLVARLPGHMELLGELDALAADPPGPRQAAHPPRSGEATRRPGAKVAIPLPCFNDGLWLPDAVASAEAQTIPVHLVIADDESTDPLTLLCLECLERSGFHVVRCTHAGAAATRNAAIRASSEPLILPLDADNALFPHYAATGAEILAREPDVGVVYGDLAVAGDMTGTWHQGEFDLARMLLVNQIDNCAVYRREIWERAGGYTAIGAAEDWSMWLSALEQGWGFRHVPGPAATYRMRPGQSSRIYEDPEAFRELARRMVDLHPSLYRRDLSDVIPGMSAELKRVHAYGRDVAGARDAAAADARAYLEARDEALARLAVREQELAEVRERLDELSRAHADAAAVARRLERELDDTARHLHAVEGSRAARLSRGWRRLTDRARRALRRP